MIRAKLGYEPRAQFIPFHLREKRWACLVVHRRAGKTVACVMDLVDAALRCTKRGGRFAYVAPTYSQAKLTAWDYLKQYTYAIPGIEQRESDLQVNLPNGAWVRLFGVDNFERLRGTYLDGVVLDEYADIDPNAWKEVIRPALSDRQGWAVFIGTVKGRNHFWRWYQEHKDDPEWFSLLLPASQSGIIPQEELDDAKKTQGENKYRQEYECDPEAAVEGAYFAAGLALIRQKGQIARVVADPMLPLRIYSDIGGAGANADAMALWVVQWVGQEIRVLDYIEGRGQPLSYYAGVLRERGYDKALMFLPHDGVNANNITGKRYVDHWNDAGWKAETIANQGSGAKTMRIEAVRRILPQCWFNEATTQAGIDALAYYHEKRDDRRDIGLGPDHDWSSHAADAFGLMAIAYEDPSRRVVGRGPIKYPPTGIW